MITMAILYKIIKCEKCIKQLEIENIIIFLLTFCVCNKLLTVLLRV